MIKTKLQYQSIAGSIEQQIRDGAFPSDKKLPSQKDMSNQYNCTVMTIRQALNVLEDKGLVYPVHGVGTFIATGENIRRDFLILGFQGEMEEWNVSIETHIVDRSYGIKRANIAKLLGDSNKKLCCLERIRKVKGIPILYQRSYLNDEYADVIKKYERSESLYASLSREEHTVTEGREIIRPCILGEVEATLLNEEVGSPAFHSMRINLNLKGNAILVDEAYLSGSKTTISTKKSGHQASFLYSIFSVERHPDDIGLIEEKLIDEGFWEKV